MTAAIRAALKAAGAARRRSCRGHVAGEDGGGVPCVAGRRKLSRRRSSDPESTWPPQFVSLPLPDASIPPMRSTCAPKSRPYTTPPVDRRCRTEDSRPGLRRSSCRIHVLRTRCRSRLSPPRTAAARHHSLPQPHRHGRAAGHHERGCMAHAAGRRSHRRRSRRRVEARACLCCRKIEEAHRYEHALEVQLPFLQVLAPGFQFVPITVGTSNFEVLSALGVAIGRVLAKQNEPRAGHRLQRHEPLRERRRHARERPSRHRSVAGARSAWTVRHGARGTNQHVRIRSCDRHADCGTQAGSEARRS